MKRFHIIALLLGLLTACDPKQEDDIFKGVFFEGPNSVDLEKDLLLYMPLNGDAQDASGRGNHGGVSGAKSTLGRDGKENGAARFDGINDYIIVKGTLGLSNKNVSISMWVNSMSLYQAGAFIKVGDANGYGFGVGNASFDKKGDRLVGLLEAVSWMPIDKSLPKSWHHLVFMLDEKGTPYYYYDGQSLGHTPNTIALTPSGDIRIGGYQTASFNRFFNGEIDDVRIYNRKLTEPEIQILYKY